MRLGARIGRLALGLLVIAVVLFALPARLPGGTESGLLGARENDVIARSELRSELHLDRALPVRFLDFLGDAADGDLGHSPVLDADVGAVVGERLVESLALALAALGVACMLCAPRWRRRGRRRARRRARAAAPTAIPTAVWWLPLLGVLVVAPRFGGMPTARAHAALATRAGATVLPALLLGAALAIWATIGRRGARDLIAALTIGTLVTDAVFGLPGLGSLLADAARAPDPLTTRGALVVIAVVVLVGMTVFVPAGAAEPSAPEAAAPPGRGRGWRAGRGTIAAVWIAVLVATVVARGDLGLAPAARLNGRGPTGVSSAHPFGTDAVGRDVLARVLATARGSLLLVVAGLVIATVAGALIGLVVGFAGGRLERLGIAVLASWAAFPGELVAIALLAFNGRGGTASAIALAFVAAPSIARGAQQRTLDAVRASNADLATGAWLRSFGSRVSFGVVRATLGTVFVGAGRVLVAELAAGLLGFGPAATQTWSHEIAAQLQFAPHAPQAVAGPAVVALLTAAALTALGNAIRPDESEPAPEPEPDRS